MKNSDFAEVTGYLRVLEKKVITNDSLDRVMDALSAADTLRLLSQNSEYDFSAVKTAEDYTGVLGAELVKVYQEMYKISKSAVIVDIPAAKYDYHNIKVALKAKIMNKPREDVYIQVSRISADAIKNSVITGEGSDTLPPHISEAIVLAEEAFNVDKNPLDIDMMLDKHMFSYLLELCKELSNDFITGYVRYSIDYYNIKTFVRVRNMNKGPRFLRSSLIDGGITSTELFVENYDKPAEGLSASFYYKYFGDIIRSSMDSYVKTGNFAELERQLDNELINYLKKSKYIAFGPEVLFSYIYSKENEMRQIRILMTCKINNIKTDILKERLRENYA